jgi:tryptophanyl-tRNA synthetase
VQTTAEQELEQLKQYARKMSKSSKAEAIAFLQRAGILDSKGNVKKAYQA